MVPKGAFSVVHAFLWHGMYHRQRKNSAK